MTDSTGAAVPNSTVTAINGATNVVSTTKTTDAGNYNFINLDPGIYSVTIASPGFQKLLQQNVHVDALESRAFNPVLTVGSNDVQITVTGAPPQLESSNATLGATIEQETYAELPIEMGANGSPDQRRATDFIYLMPGVQGNATSGNATTNTGVINGSGSHGGVAEVYVDGLPFVNPSGNGDPRFVWEAISVDAVDQMQLQTSGYAATYEGQGVLNFTLKQGTPKQHGQVYWFVRNTAFDTWGFYGKAPNPLSGLATKPVEHSNEFGINLSGPAIPFGKMKDKLFYFFNYNGFHYSAATPTSQRFPSTAEQQGDFSNDGVAIYDPLSQAACTANSSDGPCRYQYGYGAGAGVGSRGNPTATGARVNVIPANEFSTVAKNMQFALPAIASNTTGNNYISPNLTGLNNYSTTERADYVMNSKDTWTLTSANGYQHSRIPVGQTAAGRNVGPVPYNYGQAYSSVNEVALVEETHVFSPTLINQFKYGFGRNTGPSINADQGPAYAATKMGITGLPAGQASDAFPFVTFAGTTAPTGWSGRAGSYNAQNLFILVDNISWTMGKHSFTFGGEIAWMNYKTVFATTDTTPVTLANAVTETAGLGASSNASPTYAVTPGTGLSYASFLVGEIDTVSFTKYLRDFDVKWRPISGYVQDDWKISKKLTLNLGLRYDFFPTVTEAHNAESYFSPTLANPITGVGGALQFTGYGAGTCNCRTPVSNYHKNIEPRIGVAYQIDSKTVVRSAFGIMTTHGNAVGGGSTSVGGQLGFSAAPTFSPNGLLLSTSPFTGSNGAIPAYTGASGVASGPAYGTGYTTTSGYTGTPSGQQYADPYLGSRAPEYINWNLGIERQLAKAIVVTATYVGNQGHFEPTDGGNPRGYWSDQLDPSYLSLGSALTTPTGGVAAACLANHLTCPSNYTGPSLATALKPFPFQSVSDIWAYVANSNYHSVQTGLTIRDWRGLTLNANYTFSRTIDDGGTFRTGYAIPAGYVANEPGRAYPADRIERTLSTTHQPQHFVATAVWAWPLGKTIFAGNTVERAILGGFRFSEIYQAYSGSPLALTASACQTNPAQITCEPTLNPGFSGSARQNGKWGKGATYSSSPSYIVPSVGSTSTPATGPFIAPSAPSGQTSLLNTAIAPAYTFGNASRTAAYNLYGPGNYQLDLAAVRSFPLHITESTKLDIRAEWYNVTNHTLFGIASTQVGNGSFGQVTSNAAGNRKAAQFSARISF